VANFQWPEQRPPVDIPVMPSSSVWRRLAGTLTVVLLAACADKAQAPTDVLPPPAPRVVASRLPQLTITTDGSQTINSTTVYLPGSWALTDTLGSAPINGRLEIRGRGRTTWTMPKKPYRLRLAAATGLLGMPSNRHWVLLANYADKTLFRTEFAMDLGRDLRMEWTPRSQQVEVTLNGQYQGIYQLIEHIRIDPNRINIPELRAADTTAATITGGYVLEIDEERQAAWCFTTPRARMSFCGDNPDNLGDTTRFRQREYIQNYITQFETVLFSPNFADPVTGYAAWIDVESFVQYYLINEFVRNIDGDLRRSTFVYKKRDGKLFLGPLWDYDLTSGNADYLEGNQTAGWHIRRAPWYARLFEDPAFKARVAAKWAELGRTGAINRWFDAIDAKKTLLSVVQRKNFERWDILNIYVWPNAVVTGSYEGETLYMSNFLWSRKVWMDANIGR
jgi:hypothetical protein